MGRDGEVRTRNRVVNEHFPFFESLGIGVTGYREPKRMRWGIALPDLYGELKEDSSPL